MSVKAHGQSPASFILPALLLLAVFVAYPLVSTIWLSFTDSSGHFAGLQNYVRIVTSTRTERAAHNTIIYILGSIVGQMVVGTAAGIVLNEKLPGQGIARTMTLVPWIVPGIVGALTWTWMYHTDYGLFNQFLTGTGLTSRPVRWLSNPNIVLYSLIVVNIWKMFPFVAVMVLAGLQNIPLSLYEAARVDGASFWDEIRHITLPQLRPILGSVTLLLIIDAFNSITIVYSMTGGGPADRSLITSIQIFEEAFKYFDFNAAGALSILFFLVAAVVIVLQAVVESRRTALED